MDRIRLEYLFKDQPVGKDVPLSDYDTFEFISEGSRLIGQIIWPAGFYKKRPCVIMLHGYPGSARNDDLAHAFCRIGCVVITPHHRGAWGSEGKYLPSHCVEDAVNLVKYAQSDDFSVKYDTDPKAVFLIGHSMGGNTVLNAGRQLPDLRGIVMLTPFDPTRYLRDGNEKALRELLPQCRYLNCDGEDSIYQDIVSHLTEYAFENAFEDLKDQNICCIGGSQDLCAPPDVMFGPLWNILEKHNTSAIQRYEKLPAGHGLLGCRQEMIQIAAQFAADSLN